MNSKDKICNLALSRLGMKEVVKSLDRPSCPIDIACVLWYDICRQITLKKMMPNFALDRAVVAESTGNVPPFGYTHAYQKPAKCLRVLGIGEVQEKENNYSVEGRFILTSESYDDGMPVRFIRDEEDIATFSPEFILAFSSELADMLSLTLTQDAEKVALVNEKNKEARLDASALNGQENTPIRISTSRFRLAKTTDYPRLYNKQ